MDKKLEFIAKVLDEKKAEEIESVDLSNIDYVAQKVVIASSLGGKHTQALYQHLKDALGQHGEKFVATDETEDWIVADLGDIMVHIMTPQYRKIYSIESFLDELKKSKKEYI
ncbi:MAG: ribosome silencing factor [Campylobacterales bacterium]|nr:ribosome silencing factor [Campylobacterales bacterium]